MSQPADSPQVNTGMSFGSYGYRSYVLGALLLAYIFNFIDRVMVGIVLEGIKKDFLLSDLQLGLLSGLAFAVFYTLLGIPIARLSERFNRVWIIGISILIWSVFTALCGIATGFWMLFAFRVGVGIGEAGLTPPANSLISDYYKPSARGQALAIYAMGITVGTLCANLFVGLFGATVTWQQTFIAIGLAGIPVGLIMLFTVKEAPRGYSDLPGTVRPEGASIAQAFGELSSKPTFWLVSIGAMLASFVGYGMGTFVISFLIRAHQISLPDAALNYMAPISVVAAIGTFFCGFIVEKFFGGRSTASLWLTALSLVIASLAYVAAFNIGVIEYVFPLLLFANLFHYWYLGPMYAVTGAVVSARTRATAIAILLFIVNLLGYGLGPLFVGFWSERFANGALADHPEITSSMCSGDPALMAAETAQACAEASSAGLQGAITVTVLIFLLAAAFFMAAKFTFDRDSAIGGTAATN